MPLVRYKGAWEKTLAHPLFTIGQIHVHFRAMLQIGLQKPEELGPDGFAVKHFAEMRGTFYN
jgi:hypothetical protein